MLQKNISFYGVIAREKDEYNLMANLEGAEKFESKRLIKVFLDEISDEIFNKLLTAKTQIRIKFMSEPAKMAFNGQILGGTDPTRPARDMNVDIKPQQVLTILLDKIPNKKVVEKEKVKIIFLNKNYSDNG